MVSGRRASTPQAAGAAPADGILVATRAGQGRRRGQSSRIPAMTPAGSPLVITANPIGADAPSAPTVTVRMPLRRRRDGHQDAEARDAPNSATLRA